MDRKRIICFGDSNTWGYDPASGNRFENRWPVVLQNIIGDEYQIIEEGQNGRTIALEDPWEWGTKRALDYVLPMIETHKPSYMLIIMLGTNDLKKKFHLPAADIAGSLQTMLEKIKAHSEYYLNTPDLRILIIAPPPLGGQIGNTGFAPFFDQSSVEESHKLAEWMKLVADQFDCEFLNAGDVTKTSDIDCLHMTGDGHEKLAKAVAGLI